METTNNAKSVIPPSSHWPRPGLLIAMVQGPPLIALIFSAIAPILPMIAARIDNKADGTFWAQWVMTTPAIGLMFGGMIGGALLDRLGPRNIVAIALGLFVIAGSAGLYVEDLKILLFSRLVLGFAGAFIATAGTWLISEYCSESIRYRLVGSQGAIGGVVAMSTLFAAGWLAETGGWPMAFILYLLPVPLLIMALFSVPDVPFQAHQDAPRIGSVLVPHWRIYLAMLPLGAIMMIPATHVPFLLETNDIREPTTRSLVIASASFMAIISSASYYFVRARLSEDGTVRAILCAYLSGAFVLGFSDGALLPAIGCAFLGVGTGLLSPHCVSLLLARAQPAARGRAIGLMFSAIFLAEFISPLLILPLRHMLGIHGSFLGIGVALAMALAATFMFSHGRRAPPSFASEARL